MEVMESLLFHGLLQGLDQNIHLLLGQLVPLGAFNFILTAMLLLRGILVLPMSVLGLGQMDGVASIPALQLQLQLVLMALDGLQTAKT
jgi:hypothetical protein